LASVERICAEDTRRTRALLSHLGVRGKNLVKLDAHAGPRAVEQIVDALSEGQSVALVTDAGMPSVSDPGTHLVSACHLRGVPVHSVPGPSAVTTAVSLSGLVEDRFAFWGFLPRSGKKRERALLAICESEIPIVLFESPNRAQQLFRDLCRVAPGRTACAARELTKLHEEVRVEPVDALSEVAEWRGELTVVVAGRAPEPPSEDEAEDAELRMQIEVALEAGATPSALAHALAKRLGRPKRQLYQQILAVDREH
jgi:16S rRNA (cytidine1402-2'-O)-methyltransferase